MYYEMSKSSFTSTQYKHRLLQQLFQLFFTVLLSNKCNDSLIFIFILYMFGILVECLKRIYLCSNHFINLWLTRDGHSWAGELYLPSMTILYADMMLCAFNVCVHTDAICIK